MKKKLWDHILLAALLTAITAGAAMLFVDTKSAWYLSLTQPKIQPPPWVFAAVWSVLYVLYAVVLTRCQQKQAHPRVYLLLGLQAVCNVLWCLTYFTMHLLYVPFAVIVVYLVLNYLTIRRLYPSDRLSAWLLVPAELWLLLAAVINYLTILLN